ncbi:hypothetical protein LZC95_09545 [Pendulispora brunnea]|uniref:Uncharacterized protein n=1 Tax=Pendulispora brunnea TaxID=2905690 RepID=A0ABZ2KEI3_9BACT
MRGRLLHEAAMLLAALVGTVVIGCGGGGATPSTPSNEDPAGGGGGGAGGSNGAGGGGAIGSHCTVFPTDNPWNQDISNAAVDPNSDRYVASLGRDKKLHPDFGSNPSYGIPYIVVPGTQPKLPVRFEEPRESDPGPYPIPLNAPVEGGESASGDRHVLAIDRERCVLYELYAAQAQSDMWHAYSGAVFDLRSNKLRPAGWTSADAAGLPILAGLVRYEEAGGGGEIRHALRFTANRTQNAFVRPATHASGSTSDPSVPPMGARFRLKASFDTSKFRGSAKSVLTALKRYGMFLADNGSSWYLSGEANSKWNDDDLGQLKTIPGSAFEVVEIDEIVKNPS